MRFEAARPEDAATVILVRDAEPGIEVYMTKRQDGLLFLGGYHVFPGGKVDELDRSRQMCSCCQGLSRQEAQDRIASVGDPARALGFFVAGVRELFEEAGVLLAEDAKGEPLGRPSPELLKRLAGHRKKLQSDHTDFSRILTEEGLLCPVSRLLWFAHWVTPATSPRRFNTYFFLAQKPPGQETSPFDREIAEAVWLSPEQAIENWHQGKWRMIPPTISSLDTLSKYNSWKEIEADYSRSPGELQRTVWK